MAVRLLPLAHGKKLDAVPNRRPLPLALGFCLAAAAADLLAPGGRTPHSVPRGALLRARRADAAAERAAARHRARRADPAGAQAVDDECALVLPLVRAGLERHPLLAGE